MECEGYELLTDCNSVSVQIMMMEAMRLSLLEHEDQQRRQAQTQSRQESETSVPATAPIRGESEQEIIVPASVSEAVASQAQSAPAGSASHSSTIQQQQHQTQPRTSSLANEVAPSFAPPSRYSLTHQELGISSSMMAELSELVDGGIPGSSSSESTPPTSAYSTPAVPQSISQAQTPNTSSSFGPGSPVAGTFTPPIGSPNRIGTNPNNPFRRMGGSSNSNSPSHSRQSSTLQASWTNPPSSPGPAKQ